MLSALPIISAGNCCCLWTLGGGMITVYFAQQQTPRPLRLIDGAKLGFAAGLAGAMVWLVTAAAVDVLMAPLQQRMMDFVLRTARDIPPEARDAMENFSRQTTMLTRLALGFMFQLFIQTPFAALGGLLGVAMFGPRPATEPSIDHQ